jgi:hypothetical protein
LQNIRLHHDVQNARINRIIAENETAILQSIPMPDQPRPGVAQLVQKVIAGHLSAPCFRRARANSSTDPSPMAINPRIQPQAGHKRPIFGERPRLRLPALVVVRAAEELDTTRRSASLAVLQPLGISKGN